MKTDVKYCKEILDTPLYDAEYLPYQKWDYVILCNLSVFNGTQVCLFLMVSLKNY